MNNGLVSVITPTYNCGRFIEETIRSVQAQTYSNWEMIIVDDCSTDNTADIVAKYVAEDKRIQYIRNDANMGAAETRNKALRTASGRWIAFLDSDDLWLSEKLERQVEFMESNGYEFSYTRYCEIDEESHETGVVISGPGKLTKLGIYAFCWPGCLTVMYDHQSVGLVQVADVRKNNDYAMWLKVCQSTNLYLLNECLAKYRRGRVGSISTHSYSTLIRWHYRLWHDAQHKSALMSCFWTVVNIACGIYKKFNYVRRY